MQYQQHPTFRLTYKFWGRGLIIMLIIGLLTSPYSWEEHSIQLSLQVSFACLLIYAFIRFLKNNSPSSSTFLIVSGALYVYTLFWIYPQTPSMYSLITIIPIFAIMFFNQQIFYLLAWLNLILGPSCIFFIVSHPILSNKFTYLTNDVWGAVFNFICIQVIIYLVFVVTHLNIEKLKQYREEIERSKQLNSINHLAASIAHEIRNPITVVKGFSQLLQTSSTLTKQEQYYVETILKELDYTQLIISDYLSLSKPSSDTEIKVNHVNREIASIVELLSTLAHNKQVQFLINEDNHYYLKMNPIELKQLFLNIIKNGIEAIDTSGTITINLTQEDDFVVVDIIDTGSGIHPDVLEKIGTPFYTLKERGTGIGLTICYTIVDKYKGSIDIQSTYLEGTTFKVRLPLYKNQGSLS